MANDGGLIATLEQWFADQLYALTYNDNPVFKQAVEGKSPKGADVWRHQLAASNSGFEALPQYSPCAFVGYAGADGAREGGYKLRQVLKFSILVGVHSLTDGSARTGDGSLLGTSKIRDLVIALFDRQHPGSEFACDEIYYIDEIEILDAPRQHVIEMMFETSYLT